jgi:hypothetical protein
MVARNRLASKLAGKKVGDDVAIRVTRKAGSWKLRLGRARPADTTIIHEGRTVLLLGKLESQAMSDMTLDVKETETGPRLTLH